MTKGAHFEFLAETISVLYDVISHSLTLRVKNEFTIIHLRCTDALNRV